MANVSETAAPVLVWSATVRRAVVWFPVSAILAMSGCADRVITLSYTPPPPSSTVSPRLTVFRLADQRGNEGDHADPLRVGGIYGGYGNRLAKVMVTQPWPPRLVSALVAEFRGAGVDAVGTDQLPLNPPADRAWLEGDLRNFSTESRWGRRAHISAIVRLRVPGGGIVVEKEIKADASGYNANNFDGEILQDLLNRAFAEFVRKVATDADIRAGLQRVPVGETPSLAARSPSPATLDVGGTQYSWILGSWETIARKSGRVDGVARVEFKQDGIQLKWRMVRKGWMAGVLTDQEGSGSVTRISELGIELSGKYDSSNPVNVVGQPARYSLVRDGPCEATKLSATAHSFPSCSRGCDKFMAARSRTRARAGVREAATAAALFESEGVPC